MTSWQKYKCGLRDANFLSPEQLESKSNLITKQSNIFSMGVILL